MSNMLRSGLAVAAGVAIFAAALPGQAHAAVTTIADKATVSLPTTLDKVDWRSYRHRHHSWHPGWRYGWPRVPVGSYAAGYAAAPAPAAGCAYGYAPGYARAPAYAYGSGWGFNPVGATLGTAAEVATTPFWAADAALSYPWW